MNTITGEHPMSTDEIEQAHCKASFQWTGCDWLTEFGTTGLNLSGLTAARALLLARATSGREREDWQAAVTWLSQVEQDAWAAERLARKALDLARDGDLKEALSCAERACTIEANYHRRLVWRPLREAIEKAQKAIPD